MKDFLWVEKYRPSTVDDVIVSESIKKQLKQMTESGEVQNSIFAGSPGSGKTTSAIAVCKDIGCDYLMINASEEGGIDTIRTRIRQYASTVSMTASGLKVVILDEADYLSAAAQPALRGFIEEFSKTCRFIFTANYVNRIIPALQSRCSVYKFEVQGKEIGNLYSQFYKRATYILEQEGVEYNKKIVADVIAKYAPDWRRVINEFQRYSVKGELDQGVLQSFSTDQIDALFGYIKSKDFKAMRKWVTENSMSESTHIFRSIYDQALDYIKPNSVPQLVLLIADYQYKDAHVVDKEINTIAFFLEMAMNLEFK